MLKLDEIKGACVGDYYECTTIFNKEFSAISTIAHQFHSNKSHNFTRFFTGKIPQNYQQVHQKATILILTNFNNFTINSQKNITPLPTNLHRKIYQQFQQLHRKLKKIILSNFTHLFTKQTHQFHQNILGNFSTIYSAISTIKHKY